MSSKNGFEAPIETAVYNKNTNRYMCDQTRLKTAFTDNVNYPLVTYLTPKVIRGVPHIIKFTSTRTVITDFSTK